RIMVLSSFCGAAKTSSSSGTCRTTFW
ncbi:hypothetical protein BVZ80_01680B, partial [Haemophilus influenzae]